MFIGQIRHNLSNYFCLSHNHIIANKLGNLSKGQSVE